MQDFIKINKDDNVAVALKPIAKGTTLNVAGTEVTTIEDIPQGHKFVIKPIKKGDAVIKYGFRIGFAQSDIEVGGWVHSFVFSPTGSTGFITLFISLRGLHV